MSRRTGAPRRVRAAGTTTLESVPLTERLIDEAWLQALLHDNPDMLPLDEIGGSWGPLRSLGREIPLPVGFVDNMFVSPTGELTLVEAKLWRNPQARREVVGQVLDYAAALAEMSYDDLEAVVARGRESVSSIWGAACAGRSMDPADEAAFVDTLSDNLRNGRFLLMVVGDGIRSDVESLAGLLGGRPDLAFHLELVELALFRLSESDDDLLVVPSLVGRTDEVMRAVVDVNVTTSGDVQVTVEAPIETESSRGGRSALLPSIESLVETIEQDVSGAAATAATDLIGWWIEEIGGDTVLNSKSVGLSVPYAHNNSRIATVAAVSTLGAVEFANQSLSDWWGIVDAAEADRRARAAGFGGKVKLYHRGDLSIPENAERVRELLTWAAEQVAIANEKEAPQS